MKARHTLLNRLFNNKTKILCLFLVIGVKSLRPNPVWNLKERCRFVGGSLKLHGMSAPEHGF